MILCLLPGVKRNSKLFRALVHFLILAAAAAPASAQVFKWVDERGVTHYGERPPQGAKATEVPDKLASPPPGRAPANPQKGEPHAAQPGQPAPPANPAAAPAPSPAQAAKAPPTPQELQAAARKAECDKARAELAGLRQGTTGYLIDEKGQRTKIDNSAAISEAEKRVSQQCGG
jgi:hypothetical protein